MKPYPALLAATFFCLCTVSPALAQDAPYGAEAGSEPLIVIRFNQPHVSFEKPLYNTISRALQVKPTAMFDVVSVTPQARDSDSQPRYNQIASQNSRQVMNALNQMGLPSNRITLTNTVETVDASEVRIFVH